MGEVDDNYEIIDHRLYKADENNELQSVIVEGVPPDWVMVSDFCDIEFVNQEGNEVYTREGMDFAVEVKRPDDVMGSVIYTYHFKRETSYIITSMVKSRMLLGDWEAEKLVEYEDTINKINE